MMRQWKSIFLMICLVSSHLHAEYLCRDCCNQKRIMDHCERTKPCHANGYQKVFRAVKLSPEFVVGGLLVAGAVAVILHNSKQGHDSGSSAHSH